MLYTLFQQKNIIRKRKCIGTVKRRKCAIRSFSYDADGNATVFPGGTLGNEMINPLAQIDNTYNNYNFKQISGNFLDYTLLKILLSLVIWDSNRQ
jgi:hypothetical protein